MSAWPLVRGLCGLAPTIVLMLVSATATATTPHQAALANGSVSVNVQQDNDKPAPPASRKKFRLRADDGRYQGFHQDDPDQLRTSDRVFIESERIREQHRALKEANATP
jgi:hypothetical protein